MTAERLFELDQLHALQRQVHATSRRLTRAQHAIRKPDGHRDRVSPAVRDLEASSWEEETEITRPIRRHRDRDTDHGTD